MLQSLHLLRFTFFFFLFFFFAPLSLHERRDIYGSLDVSIVVGLKSLQHLGSSLYHSEGVMSSPVVLSIRPSRVNAFGLSIPIWFVRKYRQNLIEKIVKQSLKGLCKVGIE